MQREHAGIAFVFFFATALSRPYIVANHHPRVNIVSGPGQQQMLARVACRRISNFASC